ncbi:AAA family ATPase [Anaerobiospirillum succiniciproducens]|uniref:AAA family ATPase n=1 Tax=Anaerobiospirillum succiniciproducens TaxID=13335 RepID=UPI002356FE72|nr:AAA family ATPase [Anaerobiospirillum succiniciproducens]MCI6863639.1 AAA family ATPase [Anaerobiospirillum succiniciproducens]
MFTPEKYLGKTIIGVLDYNRADMVNQDENTLCYIYPRYVVNGNKYEAINDWDEFPPQGRLDVRLAGDAKAQSFCKEYGAVVSFRLNSQIDAQTINQSHIRVRFNRQLGRDKSEVWIEPIDSKAFYQIIETAQRLKSILETRTIEPEFYINNCYTNHILLHCEGKFYGPFGFDKTDNGIKLVGLERYDYMIGAYSPKDLLDSILDVSDHSWNHNRLLCNLVPVQKTSVRTCTTTYDMIDHRLLLNTFLDHAKQRFNYSREEARNIKDYCNNALNVLDSMTISEERKQKLRELLPEIFSFSDLTDELMRFTVSNNELRQQLIQCIQEDKNGILESKTSKNALNDVMQNISRSESSIDSTEIEGSETNQAFATAVKDLKAKLQKAEEESSKLKSENEALNRQVDDLKSKTNSLTRRLESVDDLKVMQARYDKLSEAISNGEKTLDAMRKEIETKNNMKEELDKGCDSVLQRLQSNIAKFKDTADFAVKFIEAGIFAPPMQQHVYTSSKNSVEQVSDIQETQINTFNPAVLMNDDDFKKPEDIISMVSTYINDYGQRDIRDNDIANYLICITQGFITTFAGEPGTGKTSLCNLLSRALGLSREDTNNRFTEVSVERGWTSLRDLIGYYNPLSRKMEKSNAAVYNAFATLDAEARNSVFDPKVGKSKIAPYIILLDEANLSPIEHYWSAFFRNCDFNSISKRSISLGGNNDMMLPEQLRFLATVNFDHTTEELSARFLDRSWVITLEPADIEEESNDMFSRAFSDSDSEARPVVPFSALTRIFNPQEDDTLDDMLVSKWKTIQKIFASERCSLPISPRNIKMVNSYCLAASRCMKCNTPGTMFAPLDYAVAQKILPTINGTGERYAYLVKELLAECADQSMPICAKHLERIERNGSADLGFYQFFSR